MAKIVKKIRQLFEEDNLDFQLDSKLSIHEVAQLFQYVPVEVAIYDLKGRYKYANSFYVADDKIRKEIIGKDDSYYFKLIGISPECVESRRGHFERAVKEKRTIRFTEKLFFPEKNRNHFYKRSFHPIIAGEQVQRVTAVCLFGSDLTAVILGQQELKYLAFHDKLTGLRNRDGFYEQLDQILIDLPRETGDSISAILFCDLDNFKLVNDSLGHDIGDIVLKEVAVRITDCLRKSDMVFRLGGDEFTIIIRHLKREVEAAKVAEKIIYHLSQPFEIKGHKITYLSTSIGIVIIPQKGGDRENLVKKADTAMYAAKNSGKNQYQFFADVMTDDSIQRMKIENNLKTLVQDATFEDECNILYQPIMERNQNGEYNVIGSEALLRWSNPELGSVLPDTFIPIAEESNLISPMGEWIFYKTCKDMAPVIQAQDKSFYISVNLSAQQLKAPNIVEKIENIIKAANIDPHNVQFELTETSFVEDRLEISRNLLKLNHMGIRLAIDDFGVGFASLVYLQRIPASVIKIDKSFIQHLGTSREHRQLVKSIIHLGSNLEKDVIAEGVEKPDQLEFLKKENCHKYQGFLFSKPIEINELQAYLVNKPHHRLKI